MSEPICFRCGKKASEIEEYRELAEDDGHDDFERLIREEEGTYNPQTNTFACTPCYIAIGMPAGEPGRPGWKAPAREETT